jgi:hypothetical protein
LSREFASIDTMERARRWLVQAGFDPGQIEAVVEGVPRISVRIGTGQAAEAALIIDVAERSDPKGALSFWDLAQQEHDLVQQGHTHPHAAAPDSGLPPEAVRPSTFVVGYRVPDERPDLNSSATAAAMREAYSGRPGL